MRTMISAMMRHVLDVVTPSHGLQVNLIYTQSFLGVETYHYSSQGLVGIIYSKGKNSRSLEFR